MNTTAEKLGVSMETIKTHRKRTYLKLGISSMTDLFTKVLSEKNNRRLS